VGNPRPREQTSGQLYAQAAARTGAARRAPDARLQDALLREAAWGFFGAAVPRRADPPHDSRRRLPGPGWPEYLSLAWGRFRSAPDGEQRARARLLIPALAFDGEVQRIGAVYGEAFWEPALQLLEEATDPVIRARACAFAAARCLLADWRLACDLWSELLEIERELAAALVDPAAPGGACGHAQSDRDLVRQARRDLATVFERELCRCSRDLQRALDLHRAHCGQLSPQVLQANAEELWHRLTPQIPAAIRSGPWRERIPEWMDLHTNRLATTPGLRLAAVRTVRADDGTERLLLDLRIALPS
jgi:hypothetical protein